MVIWIPGMRILLVEDDPNAAQVLAKGLREHSYAVDVAVDGEAAIFQAGTNDYDGLILDVMLPIVDGFTVCRTIRGSGCTVPILMLTARDAVESRVEGLDTGADDYLVKPYDFRELLACSRPHTPGTAACCARASGRRPSHHRDTKPAGARRGPGGSPAGEGIRVTRVLGTPCGRCGQPR